MNDWIEHFVEEAAHADSLNRNEAAVQEHKHRRAEILKQDGRVLWEELVQLCQKRVSELNKRLAEKFGGDKTKLVEMARSGEYGFELRGQTPSFSLTVTYDPDGHKVELSGQRRRRSGSEGRDGLFVMDVNAERKPIFKSAATDALPPVSIDSVCRYIFELPSMEHKPLPPTS
jgi:hypothetical protein